MKKIIIISLLIMALLPGASWAADTKISGETLKASPVAADTTIIVDSNGGANKKITLGTIPAGLVTNANDAGNYDVFPLWSKTQGGAYAVYSTTGLTYHPSTGVLTAAGFAGPLVGNVTGNASGSSGSCTGLAATATALATPRAIFGNNFDGTAAISQTATFGTGSSAAGSIIFNNATNNNTFTIQPGTTGANISWTLPTAAAAGNGYLVTASTAGVLTYTDPSTLGSGLPSQTGHDGEYLTTNGSAASWAAAASAATAADEAADTSCFPLFNTAATGAISFKTNAGLTFNSATAVLTATGFAGPLTGNVTGNVTGASTQVGVTSDTSTNATMYIPWVTGNTTTNFPLYSSTNLSWNPSTNILIAPTFKAGIGGTSGTYNSFYNNTGTTNPVPAFIGQANTNTTSGAKIQISPGIQLRCNGWNGSANKNASWFLDSFPTVVDAPIASKLRLTWSTQEAGTYNSVHSIEQSGKIVDLPTTNGPTGTCTLGASVASTDVTNTCVTANSRIFLMPTSANAAADVGSATGVWISAKTAATSFTITHPNNSNADKTFDYWIVN